jgi:hypothetical protein
MIVRSSSKIRALLKISFLFLPPRNIFESFVCLHSFHFYFVLFFFLFFFFCHPDRWIEVATVAAVQSVAAVQTVAAINAVAAVLAGLTLRPHVALWSLGAVLAWG